MSSALNTWTDDIDAVLSRIDAHDEVGRAKGEYFKEQQ